MESNYYIYYCGPRNAEKMAILSKSILRFILKDCNSPYGDLLDKIDRKPLYIRRLIFCCDQSPVADLCFVFLSSFCFTTVNFS